MNTIDLTVYLVSIFLSAGALALSAYYMAGFQREADKQLLKNKARRSTSPRVLQRRQTSFPGIVCALPMHHVKRADAPMTDIWSR